MLGKICQALADHEVNMLALESFPNRGKFVARLIVDKPDTAKTVLSGEKLMVDYPLITDEAELQAKRSRVNTLLARYSHLVCIIHLWFGSILPRIGFAIAGGLDTGALHQRIGQDLHPPAFESEFISSLSFRCRLTATQQVTRHLSFFRACYSLMSSRLPLSRDKTHDSFHIRSASKCRRRSLRHQQPRYGRTSSIRFWPRRRLQGEDVKPRQKEGINNVGSGVQEDGVAKLHSLENGAGPEEDEFEKEVLFGKGIVEIEHDPGDRSEDTGYEVLLSKNAPNHAVFPACGEGAPRLMPLAPFCAAFHFL